MKSFLVNILLVLFTLFPCSVLAEGYISITPDSLTIEEGSSDKIIITAYNTIGDISIISNNSNVASVNVEQWETGTVDEKQTVTETISVTGNSIGTTTITFKIDAATFDEEDLSGQTKTITINVVKNTNNDDNNEDENNNEDDKNNGNDENNNEASLEYELKLNFDNDTNLQTNNSIVENSPYIIKIKSNEKYILSDYVAKKDGYTFTGWDTSDNCFSPKTSGEYVMNSNVSLNACFKFNNTDSNDNSNQVVGKNPETGNREFVVILILLIIVICIILYFKKINEGSN